ncbi:MAG: glycosyltransferase [Chloroflexota bacterium]
MSQILLLTPQLPYPPHQGTSLRNYHIICGLVQHHTVSLLSFVEENQSIDENTIGPLLEKIDRLETVDVPKRSTIKRLWQLLTTSQPDMAHRLASAIFEVKLRAILSERPFKIVQVEGIELARYISIIREIAPKSKIVFDNHNAETNLQYRNFQTDLRRVKRLPAAVYSWIQVRRLREFERWACLEADGVTAVSEADVALLKAVVGEQELGRGAQAPSIVSIPNSIDLTKYQQQGYEPISFDIIFTGKMDYRPNVDAVLWFAERVWPLILEKRPATSWAIVGQKPHDRLDLLHDQSGVTVTGFVESMTPYWQGAKVAVMPFRIGSGTRLKIIEAMASGTPIVSTPVGAEGFPVTSGEELLLVENANEMATAVLSLLDNPENRTKLILNSAEFVKKYDWRQVVKQFEAVYNAL